MLRNVPRELALVELPQTRAEVVAVYAHIVTKLLVYIINNLWKGHYLNFQEEVYVEGVHIRRSVLAGARLELRYYLANRVCCGMREESEYSVVDAYREFFFKYVYMTFYSIYV